MEWSTYLEKTHLYGRIATIASILIMLGIPAAVCMVYGVWPDFADVAAAAAPMLAIFVPSAVSELISFTPIVGSSGYIASIMGNVSNIKFPCALAAMERTNSASGTERGEAVAMCAMCISGIVTTAIIAVGVLLLVPLQPVLTLPAVSTATSYIMPALFGSMATSFFMNKNSGAYVINGKMKLVAVCFAVSLLLFMTIPGLLANQGYVMLGLIPFTILVARLFFKKGIIKVEERK